MNELALFAGAGGGLLGSRLLGWRTVCYVEKNPYCQKVIQARIKDGFLDDAPIWDDVRTFDGRPWAGIVDVVSAGFPCQPFSGAGKQLGESDERNLWPDTLRIIREARPEWVFLENVTRLLSFDYFGQILGDLAESGYDARWDCIPASAIGAPHQRDRIWIVAHANGCEQGGREREKWKANQRDSNAAGDGAQRDVADANQNGFGLGKDEHKPGRQCETTPNAGYDGTQGIVADGDGGGQPEYAQLDGEAQEDSANGRARGGYVGGCGDEVADASGDRCARNRDEPGFYGQVRSGDDADAGGVGDTIGEGLEEREGEREDAQQEQPSAFGAGWQGGGWWEVEPSVCGMVDGLASKLDRGE